MIQMRLMHQLKLFSELSAHPSRRNSCRINIRNQTNFFHFMVNCKSIKNFNERLTFRLSQSSRLHETRRIKNCSEMLHVQQGKSLAETRVHQDAPARRQMDSQRSEFIIFGVTDTKVINRRCRNYVISRLITLQAMFSIVFDRKKAPNVVSVDLIANR